MVIIISYNKQTWNEYNDSQTADENSANGAIISADRLNHMEDGISNNDINKVTDNKDGTEQLNGVQVQPFNKLSDTIGGRNLLIGTSDFTGWTLSGNTAQGTTDGLTYAHLFVDTSAVAPNFTLAESTTYTVSFDALAYSAGTTQIYIGYSEDSNGNIIASDYANATLNALDGASVRVSLTFTTPSSFTKTNFNIGCGRAYNTGGSVYIRHVKLEKGSIATDWTPAPEDKVNVADMRKPANDVAGIEETVLDNHDGSIKANGTSYDLSKSGLIPLQIVSSGSFNDLPLGTVFTTNELTDGPDNIHGYTTTTFYSSIWGGRKVQIAIADNTNLTFLRTLTEDMGGWKSWIKLADDSTVVHTDDMRKPASDVAGIEEVNAKQNKIGYTPADDSKVAHLSGANNFDTVPTYGTNNKPFAINDTGATTARPTGQAVGYQYFDTTLNKPIWYNGSKWVDSTGTTV